MENASKALIIAGAILLSILIIAIGMYIYTSSQATITQSMDGMTTSELEAFNSNFTSYAGAQTGSQVKALIGRLIANGKTYVEEPEKVPALISCDTANITCSANMDSAGMDNLNTYVTNLNSMSNQVKLKHKYWLVVNMGGSGLVESIEIHYDPV